ncbi:tetraacyldisaccharide 4'-kinase [alpha proteobacterium U9-1i]|nr:tetraacyldisaccharide 4'-kinase [alpha proteobacterium U9-1i]
MRPPEFWRADAKGRDAGYALRALLTPVSWVYAWTAAQRIRNTTPRHAPAPVICVGNFTVGGAGKTPITRALRAKLGANAHTLSRGYGGRLEGPLRVTPDMDAREVGDEPLLHAADGPAWIARDRVAGALAAAQAGAHVIIMDDGFQNPALAKDLSVVAVDAGFGVGNGQVFPAGPLRERLSDGLARADAVVMLASGEDEAAPTDWLAGFNKPVLHARLEATSAAPEGPLVAFAGLARPEKFFDTLESIGADLEEALPFDDHHVFGAQDFALLDAMADERNARLITTEKDYVRLPTEWRAKVLTLPVQARFADEAILDALLAPIVSRMS